MSAYRKKERGPSVRPSRLTPVPNVDQSRLVFPWEVPNQHQSQEDTVMSSAHEHRLRCTLCPREFSVSSDYIAHLELHERHVYNCRYCSRSYKTRVGLMRHERVHAERIYTCLQCFQKFSLESHLKRHMTTHSTPDSTHNSD
ncbi:hypothetical protein NPIL_359341 [Nephila pilipes]|uniref:C2H2-type domain-containing protein n=1 Tax=Nephila pilipes TaxID=299642 RepID=A0A8X6PP39_NEPPI|nr:hypothetical protein NPIL_359341 [Nephila pilipes]